MYYAFLAPDLPAPSRQNRFLYFIRVDQFMEEAYDQAFDYDWTQRGENLLADRAAQFDAHMFPVAVVGQGAGSFRTGSRTTKNTGVPRGLRPSRQATRPRPGWQTRMRKTHVPSANT
jgi:hypothetical protein